MSAPSVSDLGALLGRTVTSEQGGAVLQVITSMASAYTRSQGFTEGVPCDEIARGAILPAAVRLLSNPIGLLRDETHGPESVGYRSAFTGWTLAERMVLDRYRVKCL